jgi:hypothetical protein
MSSLSLKLRTLAGWPFEAGREYRLEGGPYIYHTRVGLGEGERTRTFTIPDGWPHDLFTGVPNLRMNRGEGVQVSYRTLWGLGPRRRIWVSAAATVHDWIYAHARDDQGRWVTFDEAQAIFREILHAEGWRMFRDLYHWGVTRLALSRALWNRHNDGRPRA